MLADWPCFPGDAATERLGIEHPAYSIPSLPNAPAIALVESLQKACSRSLDHKSNIGPRSAVAINFDPHSRTATQTRRVNDRYRVQVERPLAHCRRLCAIDKETEKGRVCNHWRWLDSIAAAGRPNTRTGQRVRNYAPLGSTDPGHVHRLMFHLSMYSLSIGSAVRITGEWQPSPAGTEQSHELRAHIVRAMGDNDSTVRYPSQVQCRELTHEADISHPKEVPHTRISTDAPTPKITVADQLTRTAPAFSTDPQLYDFL